MLYLLLFLCVQYMRFVQFVSAGLIGTLTLFSHTESLSQVHTSSKTGTSDVQIPGASDRLEN